MSLESLIAQVNQNIFFREFAFSRNKFTPVQQSELEFSDNVIWLDNLLITFQLKERTLTGTHTAETESKWFKQQVISKATKQIRATLLYLKTHKEITLTNEKGHQFNVANAQINKQFNVVLYSPHELLPDKFIDKKFHLSTTTGSFIHLLPLSNYLGICQTLITPTEISEYLDFRESVCLKYENEVDTLPEEAIMGQFLKGDLQAQPQIEYVDYLIHFNQNILEFNFSHILHYFEERIARIVLGNESKMYYQILKEVAKLKRTELQQFKIRFDLCIEKCKKNEFDTKPFRFTTERTGCGFVFIIVSPENSQKTWTALQNFTYAHKYDQKLNKCIGVSFFKDGRFFDIGWCYMIEKWEYDGRMENILKENFPFREVKRQKIPTYHFNE